MFAFWKPNRAIQSLWIGTRLTTLEMLAIRSFLANGHEYHLYTYEPIANAPHGTVLKDAAEILPRHRVFQYGPAAGEGSGSYSGFSNFFRYRLLFQKGGYWVDTDLVCLKPFDFGDYAIASEIKHPDGQPVPTSCLLKLPKTSPFARYCWDECRSKDTAALRWGETGPDLVETAVKEHRLGSCVRPHACFCPVHHFEVERLMDGEVAVDLAGSYAVHFWNEMWRRRGYDKDQVYHPASVYEQLKSLYLQPGDTTACRATPRTPGRASFTAPATPGRR